MPSGGGLWPMVVIVLIRLFGAAGPLQSRVACFPSSVALGMTRGVDINPSTETQVL